ncbi:Flavinator of succinate dehydrogenase-domain-containing protein [Pavlovales sp. CCMP2436]|nr:Flavinator of succinate dehydrogenase-domain-containing protein [Pavlovales sp. CCMP2436]
MPFCVTLAQVAEAEFELEVGIDIDNPVYLPLLDGHAIQCNFVAHRKGTGTQEIFKIPAAPRLGALYARGNQQATADSNLFEANDKLRRSLLYRSKQRGWLEMDIMLGNWAKANLHGLDGAQLEQFAAILEKENPDLFKWLTGQAPVPPEDDSEVMRRICADLNTRMNTYATVKSEKGSWEGKVWE